MDADPDHAHSRWSILRIIVSILLVAGSFVVATVAGIVCVLFGELAIDPALDVNAWINGIEDDGAVLSFGAIFGALVCIPALRLLAGRVEARPWTFLGLTHASLRTCFAYCSIALAFILVSDALTWWLGRPIVPPFMIATYSSSESKALLFVALVLAAPLVEEFAFRGFLFSALRSRDVGFAGCAVSTSLLWSAIHIQYDLYGIATLFVLGLLLAWARARTVSILPTLGMHAVGNAVALIEAALVSRTAA